MSSEYQKTIETLVKRKVKGNLKVAVEEIKEIEKGLTIILGELREKLEKLKNERAELLKEIEELKRIGENRAYNLEGEIALLRKEIESLKEMLNDNK